MVDIKTPTPVSHEDVDITALAPEFEVVEWTKDPALRKFYVLCALGLLMGSATTGYDG